MGWARSTGCSGVSMGMSRAPLAAAEWTTQLITLALLFGGGMAFVLYFFGRRIGGAGGGSEKDIVGVVWLVAAILLGVWLAHPRGS